MRSVNLLVEIGHPAHVHFFKNTIKIWRNEGHRVIVVTRDKEITHQLLNELQIPYQALSKQRTGFLPMLVELIVRWTKIYFLIKKHHIDVAISISGISTALPAKLAGIKSVTDTDTEDAKLSNKIAFCFSDVILTPSCYLKKSSIPRQLSYPSFHQLAHLHPNHFRPDSKSLHLFGLSSQDKYILIRLVKWSALHDINQSGINDESLVSLCRLIQRHRYRYLISSERLIPESLRPHQITQNFSHVLNLMAFSYGFIGESPTMATEAAMLGKPSVLINSRVDDLGNMVELEKKYHLLFNFHKFCQAKKFINHQFFTSKIASAAAINRRRLLKDKIDISRWLADFVIKFASNK